MLVALTHLAAVPPLEDVSTNLIWLLVPGLLGALVMLCALLLLPRHEEETDWEIGTHAALQKGQYLQHLTRMLRAIRAINNVIVTERESEKLLSRACSALTETRGYRMVWIGLVEEGTKEVVPVAHAGFEEGYLDEIRVTWDGTETGQGPTGRAIKEGEPAVTRDIEAAPGYQPWRQAALERGYRSSAALPLRFKGQVLGSLNVYSEMPDAFDIQEAGLLQEVADHVAFALASIRLEDEVVEAKRRMRQSNAALTAFERCPLPMLATDVDGYVSAVSAEMAALLGMSRREAEDAQQNLRELDLFAGAEPATHLDDLFTRKETVEFTLPQQDGQARPLHCVGAPVLDEEGNLTQTVWVFAELPPR